MAKQTVKVKVRGFGAVRHKFAKVRVKLAKRKT